MKLFIILGNQLFHPKYLSPYKDHLFFMAEDYNLCTFEKHHKLKILLFLSSMRSFKDELKSKNFNIFYRDGNKDFKLSYEKKLEKVIKEKKIKEISFFEIEPKSPCELLLAEIVNDEVPTEDKVAEIFAAIKPLLPTPHNTTFDWHLAISITALLKELLIKQIESKVRWRESVNYMIKNKINKFIEIGPGKVLSGLIKRINKTIKINTINTDSDIKDLQIWMI